MRCTAQPKPSAAQLKKWHAVEAKVDEDIAGLLQHYDAVLRYARRIGRHLERILNARWYRAEYGTWGHYLEKRFPRLHRSQAYAYIQVSGVLDDLEGIETSGVPDDSSVNAILPLAQLDDPEDRRAAYQAATADGGPATGTRTQSIAARLLATQDPDERYRICQEEGERIRAEGQQVEAGRKKDERTKRWERILKNARLLRKDARGLGASARGIVSAATRILTRACQELGEDPAEHGLGKAAA